MSLPATPEEAERYRGRALPVVAVASGSAPIVTVVGGRAAPTTDPQLMALIEAAEAAHDEWLAACAAFKQAEDAKHAANDRQFEADRAVHEYVQALRKQVRGAP